MANRDNPNGFTPIYRLGGGTIPMWKGTLKSAASVKVGDALTALTTGLLDIATAGSTTIAGVAQQAVTGVATAQSEVEFTPALEDVVFVGQCSGTGAVTDLYESVDIEGTTGIMELNENANSTGVARILRLASTYLGNAMGANARFEFVWQKSAFTGQA